MQFKERLPGSLSAVKPSTLVMTRLWSIAVLTCLVVVACERVPLTSPTGSTISVNVDQTNIPVNGQATVRAIVTEISGTPVHNGTQVNFTSSLGSFTPPEAQTVGGVATSIFLAGGTSGTTRINAYSGGASTGSGNSSGGIEVKIGVAAAAGNISVSATPSSVSQSGGVATISALVFDASSNPLPGVQVQFTASTGTLSATTAMTDSSGVARTTLNTSQTATVTAFAGAAKGDVQVLVSTSPTVTIAAPDTATAGTPVSITLTPAAAASGSAAPRQISQLVVNFGDGQSQTFTNLTGAVGVTHTYQNNGGYTITATASDVTGNTGISSKAIVINAAALPTVTLTASPNPIPAADNGFTTFTVGATAASTDRPLRSVVVRKADGTVIYSGTQGGSFGYQFQPAGSGAQSVTATVTDSSGQTASTTTTVVVR